MGSCSDRFTVDYVSMETLSLCMDRLWLDSSKVYELIQSVGVLILYILHLLFLFKWIDGLLIDCERVISAHAHISWIVVGIALPLLQARIG